MSRIVLALTALTLLSACGIKGDLERPDPLWNREEAIRRECAAAAERNEPQDARCAQYQTGAQTTPQANAPVLNDRIDLAVIERAQTPTTTMPSTIPDIVASDAQTTP